MSRGGSKACQWAARLLSDWFPCARFGRGTTGRWNRRRQSHRRRRRRRRRSPSPPYSIARGAFDASDRLGSAKTAARPPLADRRPGRMLVALPPPPCRRRSADRPTRRAPPGQHRRRALDPPAKSALGARGQSRTVIGVLGNHGDGARSDRMPPPGLRHAPFWLGLARADPPPPRS